MLNSILLNMQQAVYLPESKWARVISQALGSRPAEKSHGSSREEVSQDGEDRGSDESRGFKPKILLLDDDPDVLDLYQEMLLQLASRPEVHISTSGLRAMSMLESENFNLLICDLKMPKMDGLQVLAVVRRKYPQLKTVVMTGVEDEQMRSRAYSLGIDLYLQKPNTPQELACFMDCMESLMNREAAGGFRGVQSKSLVDLVQLECLTGSSSVLRIANGILEGKIWIKDGEVIDAETEEFSGEEAFKRITGWKTGNFEILPNEGERARRIMTSYQGLLLDSAQALDEAQAQGTALEGAGDEPEKTSDTQFFKKGGLGSIQGVEFALKMNDGSEKPAQSWGLEDSAGIAGWISKSLAKFEKLGEKFEFGNVQELEGKTLQRHLHVTVQGETRFAVGIIGAPAREEVEKSVKKVMERWAS